MTSKSKSAAHSGVSYYPNIRPTPLWNHLAAFTQGDFSKG